MNFKQLLLVLLVVLGQSQITCPSFGFLDDECDFCSNVNLRTDTQGNEYCEVTCQCGTNGLLTEFDLSQAETECKDISQESLWFVDDAGEIGCEIDCADGFRSQAGSLSTTTTTDQTCSACSAACANDENCWAYSCATIRKEIGNQFLNQCQLSSVQQSYTDEAIQAQAKLFCVREWTHAPTDAPTFAPTSAPSDAPTEVPTFAPSFAPTEVPTFGPTLFPTNQPTNAPTTAEPTSVTDSPTTSPSEAPVEAKAQVLDQYVEVLPSALQPYWYIALALVVILLLCCARALHWVFCRKEVKELTTDGELEAMGSDLEDQQEYVISVPPKRQTTRRRQEDAEDPKRTPEAMTPVPVQEAIEDVEEAYMEEAYSDLRE